MKKLLLLTLSLILLLNTAGAQQFKFTPEAADLYQSGMNALRMRKLTVAREIFNELIDKHPGDIHSSMAKRQMAVVLRDMNQHEEALAMLNDILENDLAGENTAYARDEIIDILFELQRFRQGIEMLEKWRQQEPGDIQISRNLAKFYLQTGRKDEAWLMLESVMEKSSSPAAFRDLLNLAMVSGEIEKLIQSLENRRSRFRNNEFANYLSDCYLALNRKDKAIEILKSLDNIETFFNIQTKLADLLIDTGKYEEAFEILTMSARLMPGDWSVVKKMGHCKFMQNKKSEAIEIWRKPLTMPFMQRHTFYIDLATVLLEHQLYEEALKTYYEGRTVLKQRTMFSEEVASVLDALGRKDEALEEYLQVMMEGIYRNEVFAKLYDAYEKGYDLESRLVELNKTGRSPAISQALLEFLFRKAEARVMQSIKQIVVSGGGRFDEIFYERLNQEALLSPSQFHFDITAKVMNARQNSTLALKLADLLLEMGPLDENWTKKSFDLANETAHQNSIADAQLKAKLLVNLGRYALEKLYKIDLAHDILDEVMSSELAGAVQDSALSAAILKARLFIYQEKYKEAADLLEQTENAISRANDNIFAINPISRSEFLAQVILEQARLAMHKNELQSALEKLKNIVETLTESDWTNDALEMANFIMRRSIGNFEILSKTLKAERLTFKADFAGAVKELKDAIAVNASATELISEMQADSIILQKQFKPAAEIIKAIDDFAARHPGHFKTADLWEAKWKLMKRENAQTVLITEQLQTFVDIFPNDLRSGRFSKLLAAKAEKLEQIQEENQK